jgi:hypothetical protein
MEQVSLYLSEPKANFTLKYESVAMKLSLDQSSGYAWRWYGWYGLLNAPPSENDESPGCGPGFFLVPHETQFLSRSAILGCPDPPSRCFAVPESTSHFRGTPEPTFEGCGHSRIT